MMPKVIKTDAEHEAALSRIEELMDAKAGTPEAHELELLGALVGLYEDERYPIGLPDPVDAIRFRMEQAGLRQKDLIPMIGTRSKVSEVLNRKRPLSVKMIRALHQGLGIPAEVLLQEPGARISEDLSGIDWGRFPIGEMLARGWMSGIAGPLADAREHAEELLRLFLRPLARTGFRPALLRQHLRSGVKMDEYALLAWRARVLLLAQSQEVPAYERGTIDEGLIGQVASLSYLDGGPRLAQQFLAKCGIHLIVLGHLPRTHLDGAAMLLSAGSPVVALTLRYDRLDNFWFCLCHELAHVSLHLEQDEHECFIDDLQHAGDRLEDEADKLAANSLIPRAMWRRSHLHTTPTAQGVRDFARRMRIHPAIVAGRIRRDQGNYRVFSQLVGQGEVRNLFSVERGDAGTE